MGNVDAKPEMEDGGRASKVGRSGKGKKSVLRDIAEEIRHRYNSREKVRKKKILESVPNPVYDPKSKPGSDEVPPEHITPAVKKSPLRKRSGFRIPVPTVRQSFLKSRKHAQAGKNIVFDVPGVPMPKRIRKSDENPSLSPIKRKEVVLSSPKLKAIMETKKIEEKAAAAAAEAAKAQKQLEKIEGKGSQTRDVQSKDNLPGSGKRNEKKKVYIDTPVVGMTGRFGFHPNTNKTKWHAGKLKLDAVQGFLGGKESITSKYLNILRGKIHQGGDLSRLKQFGIPDQRQLLTVALVSDPWRYDFGGNLRHYFSPLLRSYIPYNMLERYRGVSLSSPCLTSIDLSGLRKKASMQEQERQRRKDLRDKHLESLREASRDQNHFEFLKELANNQPATVPLTIVHDIVKEVAPIINQTQAFYNRHLGPKHECTEQATDSFLTIWNRLMMYNAM